MKKTTYDEVYAIVIKVLTEEFKKPVEDLKPETKIKDELNLDSLDRVDFLCAVEEAYGDDVFDMDEESEDPEVIKNNKKKQQEFYTTKTIHTFTICLLEAVNEYEERKGE